jgi:uncharacterized membrane protein
MSLGRLGGGIIVFSFLVYCFTAVFSTTKGTKENKSKCYDGLFVLEKISSINLLFSFVPFVVIKLYESYLCKKIKK